jgi:hypothetical protein
LVEDREKLRAEVKRFGEELNRTNKTKDVMQQVSCQILVEKLIGCVTSGFGG